VGGACEAHKEICKLVHNYDKNFKGMRSLEGSGSRIILKRDFRDIMEGMWIIFILTFIFILTADWLLSTRE
jgi:hypothetical protein